MTVKLTWTPSAGATTQTVQYRVNGTPTWTTHSTVGPTIAVAYVTVSEGSYQFRIVNDCTQCVCSDGSTPVNGNCPGTVLVAATSTGTVVETTPTPYEDFGESGTVVHSNLNPTGPFVQLNTSNYFWREPPLPSNWFDLPHYQRTQALLNNNGPVNRLVVWAKQLNPAGRPLNNYNYYQTSGASSSGYILTIPTTEFVHVNQLVFKGNNPSDGTGTFDGTTLVTDIISPTQVIINKIPILPLSNAVVSFSTISTPPVNTWLGFDVCINVPATKTYHIAIAADNQYRFFLDGVLKLSDTRESTEVFGYLHIYPLEIPAGSHLLRLEGLNTSLTAGFGCEIFDLSDIGSLSVVDYLNQQTNYNNLQSKIIFTTRNATQFTSTLYSCPDGFKLVNPNCSGVQCSGPGGSVPCTTVAVTPPVISAQNCPAPSVTTVTLTPGETTTPPLQECLAGLILEFMYFGHIDDLALLPAGYTLPCQASMFNSNGNGKHACNRAFFEVFANGVYVGDAIMNNIGNLDPIGVGVLTRSGKYTCQDYFNKPDALRPNNVWNGTAWSRYSRIDITASQAQAIANATSSSQLALSLVAAMTTYNFDCSGNNAGPHNDVTWFRISRPTGEVLYNGCPTSYAATIDVCPQQGSND